MITAIVLMAVAGFFMRKRVDAANDFARVQQAELAASIGALVEARKRKTMPANCKPNVVAPVVTTEPDLPPTGELLV